MGCFIEVTQRKSLEFIKDRGTELLQFPGHSAEHGTDARDHALNNALAPAKRLRQPAENGLSDAGEQFLRLADELSAKLENTLDERYNDLSGGDKELRQVLQDAGQKL